MSRLLAIFVLLSIALFVPSTSAAPAPAACPSGTCTYLPVIALPGPTILPNHSVFTRSSSSYLHIVGEVQNNTGSAIEFVKISADVFNGAQFVAADYTYTTLDILPAGQRTCFDILVQKPAAWTSYTFEPVSYDPTTARAPSLALLNLSSSIDSIGAYHIIGQVRNDEATTVTFVEPVGTLYSASGQVLDCDSTFVNSTDLNPGQTSAFDMLFFSRESYTGVASYRVQVDGNLP